jgi:hypothetical protein
MGSKSYSKGISWIDDCRIPFVDDVKLGKKLPIQQGGTIYGGGKGFHRTTELDEYKEGGRFPANLLVSDDMLNDGVISKSTIFDGTLMDMTGGNFGNTNNKQTDKRIVGGYADKGTNSRYYDIDKWFNNLIDV